MTRNVTCTSAVVLETYGDFNFYAFPSCLALSNTRFLVAASYLDGGSRYPTPPPFDSTIGLWLLDADATILDSTRVTTSDGAFLACGPMRVSPTAVVMAVESGPGSAIASRSIVGLDLRDDTITVVYQTTPTAAAMAYPGDGWIDPDGRFCIAEYVSGSDYATPVLQDSYDPATGAFLRTAPYAPNKTPLPVDQLSFIDMPAAPPDDYGDVRTYYRFDLPSYGSGSAPGDTFDGLIAESIYQPVGGGVGGVGGRGSGNAKGYVAVNYPGGRGILCGIEHYAVSGLIAAIVPSTVTPPLRQRQRSDGLAASGAPRQHQRATLQVSNRQRAIR